ncbi:Zinc finger BED domain-containing protein 5, partial [Dictyocoela muelleri]
MTTINSMQLSARTITRRIEMIADDVEESLNKNFEKCVFISLQIDESLNISDTSQLCIVAKMAFKYFSVKEEFVKLLPLKGHARGIDIFKTFKKYLLEKNIPLTK